jgi:hypothetical protein
MPYNAFEDLYVNIIVAEKTATLWIIEKTSFQRKYKVLSYSGKGLSC